MSAGYRRRGGGGGASTTAPGGLVIPSGKFLNPNGTGSTGSLGNNGRAVMTKVTFGAPQTLIKIGVDITIISTAGGKFRFGIFADASGDPGALISDFGVVAADALGCNPLTISQPVGALSYWICTAAQLQTPTLATVRTSLVVILPSLAAASTPGGSANNIAHFFDTGYGGALPGTAGTPTGQLTAANSPSLWLGT